MYSKRALDPAHTGCIKITEPISHACVPFRNTQCTRKRENLQASPHVKSNWRRDPLPLSNCLIKHIELNCTDITTRELALVDN